MQYNTRQYIFLGRSRESDTRKIGVSYFPSYTEPEPAGVVSLADFLLQPLYREKVEQIRRCPDKRRRRELKRQLPAVTPAGVFSRRCNDGLIRPSGLVGLDVDGADNPHIGNWEAVKWTISDLPGLWYAGLSASGNGLFLAFCVKCPEQYGRSFDALSQELSGRGIRVDAACRDIARLRGASYDPAPFFNPDAMPYDGYIAPKPLPVNPVRRVEVFSDKTGERRKAGGSDRTAGDQYGRCLSRLVCFGTFAGCSFRRIGSRVVSRGECPVSEIQSPGVRCPIRRMPAYLLPNLDQHFFLVLQTVWSDGQINRKINSP